MLRVCLILSLLPMISACASLGLGALNLTSKIKSDHQLSRDIAYGAQPWQRLDVYRPSQLDANRQQPVIIFFYGGGWNSGKKSQYYFAASAFTQRGYVVVVPDYVKFPKGRFPSFVEDGARAVAWTRERIAEFGGDPNELFLVGHSAGAHLGALLVADEQYLQAMDLTPNVINAFAGLAGPYNFTPEREPYTQIFGPEENYPKMQIMNFIDGDEPPMLLLHGTHDRTVGILNSTSLANRIKAKNGEFVDKSYDGVSHVGILLSLHPSYLGDHKAANDIHAFFNGQRSNREVNTATNRQASAE